MKAVYPACTVVWYSFFGQLSCSGTCSTWAKSLILTPFFAPNMDESQLPQSFLGGMRASLMLYLKLTMFFFRFFMILRWRFCASILSYWLWLRLAALSPASTPSSSSTSGM